MKANVKTIAQAALNTRRSLPPAATRNTILESTDPSYLYASRRLQKYISSISNAH